MVFTLFSDTGNMLDKQHKPDQPDTDSGENKKAVDELEEFMKKHPQRWINLREAPGIMLLPERNRKKVIALQKHK